MVDKYLKLPNKDFTLKCYDYSVINGFSFAFIVDEETTLEKIQKYFGTDIIEYGEIVDGENNVLDTFNLHAKRRHISVESITITSYEERIVQESRKEIAYEVSPDGTNTKQYVEIPAVTETVEKHTTADLATVILEKPDITEDVEALKELAGMVDTSNMTLEEFKAYQKNVIGKQCREAIYNGTDVETSLGTKHFSYTLEDQSNIKDLFTVVYVCDFQISLPYHADNEDCTLYTGIDIIKIYAYLSSHKLYHTTYCNILNSLINKATDIKTVREITYGMDVPVEYQENLETLIEAGELAIKTMLDKIPVSEPKSE